jgi:glycosyltransferase involved in cell wall biosynthesis
MSKLAILTQYYPPETGAPQNRLHSLSKNMIACGYDVTVFTSMPNYPNMEVAEGYKKKWHSSEVIDEVKVYRSWLFVSKNPSIVFRLINYFSFCATSFFRMLVRMKRSEVIICESPPLFLGITAVLISRIKRTPLVFNVSDLWPKSAEELGLIKNKSIIRITTLLEEWIYKKSSAICGQTKGIVGDIQSRFPQKPIYWFPNGVDSELIERDFSLIPSLRKGYRINDQTLVIGYAGIIGHAQGLEIIISAAKTLVNQDLLFLLAGSGPMLSSLQEMVKAEGLQNIMFIGSFPKEKMLEVIATFDLAFVPLKKSKLFLGAIPSKIFENLALKKPLLLGVDGEAKALFIDQGKAGLFYEPENSTELTKAIEKFISDKSLRYELGENGRKFVIENFNRKHIAESFAEFLKNLKK